MCGDSGVSDSVPVMCGSVRCWVPTTNGCIVSNYDYLADVAVVVVLPCTIYIYISLCLLNILLSCI